MEVSISKPWIKIGRVVINLNLVISYETFENGSDQILRFYCVKDSHTLKFKTISADEMEHLEYILDKLNRFLLVKDLSFPESIKVDNYNPG